jgi:hypothetical protein
VRLAWSATSKLYYRKLLGPKLTASISIAWFLLAIPLLSFPTGLPVTAQAMNCEWNGIPLAVPEQH